MPIDIKNIQHMLVTKRGVILKGLAIGGTFGMVGIVASKAFKARSVTEFDGLTATGNATLGSDLHIAALCERLQPYHSFDPGAFNTILVKFAELVHLNTQVATQAVKVKLSLPRHASLITSDITESIRRLRAKLNVKMGTNSKVMEDFDDIASGMQQSCTDLNFNISMTVTHQFSK